MSTTQRTSDAAKVAGGSGITFAGILTDRGLRWGITWLLTHLYGPEIQGLYAFTTKALTPLIAAFASLGLDTGIIYFGARHRKLSEHEKLKGVLLLGAMFATLSGIAAAAAVALMPDWLCAIPRLAGSDIGQRMCSGADEVGLIAGWGAVIVGLWIPLLFLVGALRARKDMKRSALAFQITLPVTLLVGILASWLLGAGLGGALAAYAVAALAALLAAAAFCWKHYGALLRDRSISAQTEPAEFLKFSIPQTLAATVFRLNTRLDFLMIIALSGSAAVGFYDVATGLAVLGALPVNAVITMFNPFIAELASAGETERLDALLKTVTRWLILASVPVYGGLILLADVLIGALYPAEYAAAALPLVILCAGQIVNVACSPTMRLIPMSGHTLLNFINGVVALILGVVLNLLLIPDHGIVGAAMATAITLSAWALWRVAEVWHLLKCFPFTLRSAGLLLGTVGAMAAVHLATHSAGLPVRLAGVALLLLAYAVAARLFGITAEDEEIVEKVKRRVRRLVGRIS